MNEYKILTDDEMIEAIENVWANVFSFRNHDDKAFSKILSTAQEIEDFIKNDMQIDPYIPDTPEIKDAPFDF